MDRLGRAWTRSFARARPPSSKAQLSPGRGGALPALPAAGQEWAAHGALARQAASPGARAQPQLTRKDIFN